MSSRTTRCTPGKSNNQMYLTAHKQQSHGDADDKAQPPLYIAVLAIKHRSPKYEALHTLHKPVNAAEHTDKLPSASKIYSKKLSELPQFPSTSFISSSVSLIIHYFWPPNYIEEKAVTVTRESRSRAVKITPPGRRDINTSRQSPQIQVLAAKNSYR